MPEFENPFETPPAEGVGPRVTARLADGPLEGSKLGATGGRHEASPRPSDRASPSRAASAQCAVRLEVEDPSHRGAVAPRPPDLAGGGGFGLNLVQELSERWGLECDAAGGTRVWAQVELGPLARLPRPPRISRGALDARG
jgi:hypothetical protein